jgi:hypothetical protein
VQESHFLKVTMFRRSRALAARLKLHSQHRLLAFACLSFGIALITGAIWARPNREGDSVAGIPVTAHGAATREVTAAVSPAIYHPRVVPPMPAEYQRLLKRSIFSRRSKGKPRDGDGGDEAVRTVSQFVLRGVAVHEGKYIAFVENTTENNVIRVGNGDHVAGGKLTHLTLGGARYDSPTGEAVIPIGSALDGTLRRPPSTSPALADTTDDKPARKQRKTKDGQAPESAAVAQFEAPNQKAR